MKALASATALRPLGHATHFVGPLIIESPELQSGKQRAFSHTLTMAFWVLWVVLWLPLVTVLAWFFFGYKFHFHMIQLDGYVGFLDVLGTYALIIVGMSGALLVWAKYNHLRFRGVDRRRPFAPPQVADLARLHSQPEDEVMRWQAQRIVTVHHHPDGRIERVDA